MKTKIFIRRIEDFICENCGKKIVGDGYTDHCPNCLYSKHVDVTPGDRANSCKGTMKPIGITVRPKQTIIHYICLKCGYKHQVKAVPNDNFDLILDLSTDPTDLRAIKKKAG